MSVMIMRFLQLVLNTVDWMQWKRGSPLDLSIFFFAYLTNIQFNHLTEPTSHCHPTTY